LRTPLIDRLEADPGSVDPVRLGSTLAAEARAGRGHDMLPFTGQSAALVHDIAPAAEILSRLVAEAEAALASAGSAISP
jgi:enoyl-[acyl-carrier protein] reductase II